MIFKPIETKYKGYRFRSKLEARWAVFYDSLGLKWEYEKEGFDINGKWYLPDFLVTLPLTLRMDDKNYYTQGNAVPITKNKPALTEEVWIEIKGKRPSKEEEYLLQEVCKGTNKAGFIFYYNIPFLLERERRGIGEYVEREFEVDTDSAITLYPYPDNDNGIGWDNNFRWCECPECGKPTIQFEGRGDRHCGLDRGVDTSTTWEMALAYNNAREIRFDSH